MNDQFSKKLLSFGVIATSLIFIFAHFSSDKNTPLFSSPPATFKQGKILKVELLDYGVVDMNGIGDDWIYASYLEDDLLEANEPIEINLDNLESVELVSIAVEEDPKHDDRGEEYFKITPQNLPDLVENEFYTADVGVYERHGSGAGNTAQCEFTYRITTYYLESDSTRNEIAIK